MQCNLQLYFSVFQVHFAEENTLATVHPIIAWNYAYAAARKGPWEQFARDRDRFDRKIQELSKVLNPVLSNCHREKVYSERFSDKVA